MIIREADKKLLIISDNVSGYEKFLPASQAGFPARPALRGAGFFRIF